MLIQLMYKKFYKNNHSLVREYNKVIHFPTVQATFGITHYEEEILTHAIWHISINFAGTFFDSVVADMHKLNRSEPMRRNPPPYLY